MPSQEWEQRRSERLRELRTAQAALRKRVILMVIGLVGAIGLLLTLPKLAPPRALTPQAEEPIASTVALPPVDAALLAEVRDGTPQERFVLEPEPFAYLARMSLALVPDHLRLLGEPAFPFATDAAESAELRARPFRLRGELLERRALTRMPGAPEEYWFRLRADDGHEFFFVSLRDLEEFRSNYFRADGYFFKLYEGAVESSGPRVTAPLFVGRALEPSFRALPPATAVDPTQFADVRDAGFGNPSDLDPTALWHLLAVARHFREHPQAREQAFAGAPELTRTFVEQQLHETPDLFRGRPIAIPGQVVPNSVRYQVGEENPLRLEYVTHGYLGNLSLGKQPVHLIAPGKFPMVDPAGDRGQRRFYGWFLQFEVAIDAEDNVRLYPVFVVADTTVTPVETPAFMRRAVIGFFLAAALLAGFMAFLVFRDKRQSARFSLERDARRRKRQAPAAPTAPKE